MIPIETKLKFRHESSTRFLNAALKVIRAKCYSATRIEDNCRPGTWNVDASLHKTFSLTERVGIEISADGIDVLHRHNFYANTTTLEYSGAITTPLYVQELRGVLVPWLPA
jgi:hypothetical protein